MPKRTLTLFALALVSLAVALYWLSSKLETGLKSPPNDYDAQDETTRNKNPTLEIDAHPFDPRLPVFIPKSHGFGYLSCTFVDSRGNPLPVDSAASHLDVYSNRSQILAQAHFDQGVITRWKIPAGLPLRIEIRSPLGCATSRDVFLLPSEDRIWGVVKLVDGVEFKGRVFAPDATTLEGLLVELLADGSSIHAIPLAVSKTDSEGRFSVAPVDRSLRAQVRITPPSDSPLAVFNAFDVPVEDFTSRDGWTTSLETREVLGGRAFDQSRQPLIDARVISRRHEAGRLIESDTRTDRDGTFLFSDLASGFYTVSVEATSFRTAVKPNISTGQTATLFILSNVGRIEGPAPRVDGVPLNDYSVAIYPSSIGDSGDRPLRIDRYEEASGGFIVPALDSGSYDLELRVDSLLAVRLPSVAVSPGDVGYAALTTLGTKKRGAIIRGSVLNDDGIPIEGAWVMSTLPGLRHAEAHYQPHIQYHSQYALSDAQGRFEIRGVSGASSATSTSRLLIRAPGMVPQLSALVAHDESRPVELPGFRLKKSATLKGRIEGAVRGAITLELLTVRDLPIEKEQSLGVPIAHDLTFFLEGLAEGTYKIRAYVDRPGSKDLAWEPNHEEIVRVRIGQTEDVVIRL